MNEKLLENGTETTENPSQKRSLPPKITKENILPPGTKKDKALHLIKLVVTLILSSFLVSFAVHYLILPNDFAIGGVSGIAIILEVATNGFVKPSITTFLINFPLIVLSFFFVRRRFAVLTTSHIFLQSAWLAVMENAPFPSIDFGEQKIFAALAAGVCIGTAIALAFKIGGSTGGADIVAVMIQRKVQAQSLAWMLFTINCIIIGAGIFVFAQSGSTPVEKLLPILMAVVEQFVESKINESISNGFQSAIEFRVITSKPEEMAEAIMFSLSRGVTAIPAIGMYTKEERKMVICVINRRQIATFKRILKEVDPDSFAVMSNVSQVVGLGFSTGEI